MTTGGQNEPGFAEYPAKPSVLMRKPKPKRAEKAAPAPQKPSIPDGTRVGHETGPSAPAWPAYTVERKPIAWLKHIPAQCPHA
jgi:hypothetical protein